MDEGDLIFVAIIGTIIGIFLMVIVLRIEVQDENKIEELGHVVCDEIFGMDFKSYRNQELKCQQKDVVVHIDGIKVNLGKYNSHRK